MKSVFSEYYRPKDEDFESFLKSALIVVDTNVILNCFRRSQETVDELLRLFRAVKNQLHMPFQIGFEYHENVDVVITEMRQRQLNFQKLIESEVDKFRGAIAELQHPFVSAIVLESVDALEESISRRFAEERWNLANLDIRTNNIRSEIEALWDDDKIGLPFSDDEIKAIIKEGETRYKSLQPPGFKDSRKSIVNNKPFGDLFLWKQMIAVAKQRNAPILFVTDDGKDDWWLKIRGETKGPLPALRAEMRREAAQDYYSYSSDQFIKYGAPLFLKRKADSIALATAERDNQVDSLAEVDIEEALDGFTSAYERYARLSNSSALIRNINGIAQIGHLQRIAGLGETNSVLKSIYASESFRQKLLAPTYAARLLATPKIADYSNSQKVVSRYLDTKKMLEKTAPSLKPAARRLAVKANVEPIKTSQKRKPDVSAPRDPNADVDD